MSDSTHPPVDVAAVLAEIREGVRQRRATLPPDAPLEPALSDIDLRRLLAEVEATRVVRPRGWSASTGRSRDRPCRRN
jgi:hypothetical protein